MLSTRARVPLQMALGPSCERIEGEWGKEIQKHIERESSGARWQAEIRGATLLLGSYPRGTRQLQQREGIALRTFLSSAAATESAPPPSPIISRGSACSRVLTTSIGVVVVVATVAAICGRRTTRGAEAESVRHAHYATCCASAVLGGRLGKGERGGG